MADMSKIFKPRRGKQSTMAGTKKTTVLANGEMFIEVPDTGAGTGHARMKMGDGSTAYSELPYAMGDTENDEIAFGSNTSTTVATALNSVTSGGKLKNIIAGLKQAVSLCNTSITQLNDDISNIQSSFQDGVDSIYNALVAKGSTPASKSPKDIVTAISSIKTGYTQEQYIAYGNTCYNNGKSAGASSVTGSARYDTTDHAIQSSITITLSNGKTKTVYGALNATAGFVSV